VEGVWVGEKGEGGRKGEETTQTFYVHMNKKKIFLKRK
jgi:hypothetical protein